MNLQFVAVDAEDVDCCEKMSHECPIRTEIIGSSNEQKRCESPPIAAPEDGLASFLIAITRSARPRHAE